MVGKRAASTKPSRWPSAHPMVAATSVFPWAIRYDLPSASVTSSSLAEMCTTPARGSLTIAAAPEVCFAPQQLRLTIIIDIHARIAGRSQRHLAKPRCNTRHQAAQRPRDRRQRHAAVSCLPLRHQIAVCTAVTRADLHRHISEIIAQWSQGQAIDPARVDRLLLDLFAYQVDQIAGYAAFCQLRGIDPSQLRDWRQIPLIPVAAFQSIALSTPAAVQHPTATFQTSGTTTGHPGVVHLASTDLYDQAAQAAFAHWLMPDRPRQLQVLALVPSPELRPHSALGHMVAQVGQRLGQVRWMMTERDALDVVGMTNACVDAQLNKDPVLICATTLALALLQEQWPTDLQIALPAGSRLMDTGGPKGRKLHVDRATQHAWLCRHLGLRPDHMVGEFGMTELSSQRYEPTLRAAVLGGDGTRTYAGPPWLRTRVLELPRQGPPLVDCATGVTGLVGHLDLANLDTCAFVQTADLGALDTRGHLTLHGRLPGSKLRGCGLDAEELGLA